MAVDRIPPWSTSALWLDETGRLTVAAKAFIDAIYRRTGGFTSNVATTVATLSTTAVNASLPQTHRSISVDLGVTWSPLGTAGSYVTSLVGTFTTSDGDISTQAITGTRTDATGNWTLTTGAHTGSAIGISLVADGTQTAVAILTHTASGKQTTLSFVSVTDVTALGGASGGSGPSK